MPAVTGSAATGQASGAAGLVDLVRARQRASTLEPNEIKQLLTMTAVRRRSRPNTVGLGDARPGAARLGPALRLRPARPRPRARADRPGQDPAAGADHLAAVVRAAQRAASRRTVDDRRARLSAHARRRLHVQAPVGAGHRAGRGRLPGRRRRQTADARRSTARSATIDLQRGPRRARRARPAAARPIDPTAPAQGPGRQGPERARLHRARGRHRRRRQPRRGPQGAVRLPRHDAAPGLRARTSARGGEASQRLFDLERRQQARHRAGRLERRAARAATPTARRCRASTAASRCRRGSTRTCTSGAPSYSAVDPPREVLRTPAIGDIDGDLEPEIVDSAGEHVYAWNADGSAGARLPGAARPGLLAAAGPHARQPRQARLHRLAGAGRPERRRQARHRHRRRSTSTSTPGTAAATPLPASRSKLQRPDASRAPRSSRRRRVGDITGDGRPDIVTPTQEFDDNPSAPRDARRRRGRRLLATSSPTSSRTCSAAAGASTRSTATATCCPGWPTSSRTASCPTRCRSSGPGVDHILANVDGDPRARGDRQRRERRRDRDQRRRLERGRTYDSQPAGRRDTSTSRR